MRAGATVLVLLLALAALPAPPAEAQTEKVLRWDYTVRLDEPESGAARVTIRLTGLKGVVESVEFLTQTHSYTITNVTREDGTLEPTTRGVKLNVKSDVEAIAFHVNLNRPSPKAGEYNAYLGPDWGVFKAEALALGFTYSYVQGIPWVWSSTVRWVLPAGWKAEMPYPYAGTDVFQLPRGEVLPRGFVVAGPVSVTHHEAVEKEFRYARVGNTLPYESDIFPYLANATPYYAQVYGDASDRVILTISAPSPMFKGGLGSTNSLFVHDDSDLRTFAHEYAHVSQLFASDTTLGKSTIWLNEGDAEYHGALSLFVTNYWSLDRVNTFLADYHAERAKEPYRATALPDATYGTTSEDVAYHKGALVVHALDGAIADATKGAAGVSDVLRHLNEAHDQRVRDDDPGLRAKRLTPITNEEILAAVNAVVQQHASLDLTSFFTTFVYGKQYPELAPVAAGDNLVITNVTLAPERALQGETVTATVTVENRGIAPATKRVPLTLDGEVLGAQDARVEVGQTVRLNYTFTAPEPGPHEVAAYYAKTTLHVARPASLHIERIATIPERPVAGDAATLLVYVANAGETDGDAHVEAHADGTRPLGRQTARVAGGLTSALAFPVVFASAGPHAVEARLVGTPTPTHSTVNVEWPDADGDGVPDPDDAYPDNPGLSTRSGGNDVKNALPAPGLVLALAGVALAVAATRRR